MHVENGHFFPLRMCVSRRNSHCGSGDVWSDTFLAPPSITPPMPPPRKGKEESNFILYKTVDFLHGILAMKHLRTELYREPGFNSCGTLLFLMYNRV